MIYTFYSYKGGVGRSMALANIAELFYEAGLKVLMVDWDLEAPGLERFFFDKVPKNVLDTPGVMDLIMGYKQMLSRGVNITDEQLKSGDLPFEKPDEYLINIHSEKSTTSKLWLLSAGRRSPNYLSNYTSAVLGLDWKDLYQKWGGEVYFEWLREQFIRIADVVVIDSRTGFSEMGGVCTYQLADVVVMFCSASEQSLDGIHQLLVDLRRDEIRESRGRKLDVLVIPARVENAESDYLNQFQAKFLRTFSKYMPQNMEKGPALFDQLAIPYTPRYAYKETIAVKEKRKASARKLVDAFNRLAFAMSRLAPKGSSISAAFPQTEITIGGETIIGSVISGSVVVGSQVLDTRAPVHTDIAGRDIISTTTIIGTKLEDERAYLDGLISRYKDLNNIYIPLAGIVEYRPMNTNEPSIDFSQSFIPLEFENLTIDAVDQIGKIQEQVEDIREPFKRFNKIIILGEPGSGKTATLSQLTFEYAKMALENPDAALPVFLRLDDIKGNEYFEDYLGRYLGPLSPYLETILLSRGVVMLLDGLNEIPKSHYSIQVRRIREWQARYPNQLIAITCRTREFKENWGNFCKIEISSLASIRIQSFIQKFLKEEDATQLTQIINGDRALKNLGRNPYILFMIIQIYVKSGEIPANRTKLYSAFVDTLLSREQKRMSEDWIDIKQQKAGLASLAYAMQVHAGKGTTVDKAWALDQIRKAVTGYDSEQLLALATNANLLVESGTKVGFSHKSFQEYFAALEVADRASK
jgi:hypothetical protein